MMNESEIEEFREACEKHFKLKSFTPKQIIIQAEDEGARSHWSIAALVLGILGVTFIFLSLSIFLNDEDVTSGYYFIGFSIFIILLAIASFFMKYRKPNTFEFDKDNNLIYITINRGSNQVTIQENETDKNYLLTESRFSTSIANTGGITFASLCVHLETGRSLMLDNVEKTNITDTTTLYMMLMIFTDDFKDLNRKVA